MKKFLIILLGICLIIGLPFIGMDLIAKANGPFNIPSGYKKISIDLKEKGRYREMVLTKQLDSATEISFMMQSNSGINSTVCISSGSKLIGGSSKEETYTICNMTGNSYVSPKLLLQPGKYEIKVSNIQTDGRLIIGYREKKIDASDYERLLKIDGGDLNNPPKGYELAYSTDLTGQSYNKETVYSLTIDKPQKIGISVYTNSSKGNVSVDFTGRNNNFINIVTPKTHYICEQMENTYSAGDYQFQLTGDNADGQIYIFIKK